MTWLSEMVAWVMAAFYSVVHNYAFSIVAIGVTFMVLIIPFNLKSTRSMLAMQKLQPKMKQLQQQHKNDKLALQQAVSELYKQEGVNPLGGCIPTLIPLPLLYVLYHVITGMSHVKKVAGGYLRDPLYLNTGTRMWHDLMAGASPTAKFPTTVQAAAKIHALGLNLSISALKAIDDHLGFGAIFGALFLVLLNVGANYYQQVQISNLNPMIRQNQQMAPQMKMMRYLPIFLGVIWINLGSGLVLYYTVSALFRVTQQWMMYHYDPKVKELVAKDDHDIDVLDAKLQELEHRPPGGAAGANAAVNPKLTPPRPFVEPTAKANPAKANAAKSTPAKANAAKSIPAKANVAKSIPAKANTIKTNGVKADGANGGPQPAPPDPSTAGTGERDRKRKGR